MTRSPFLNGFPLVQSGETVAPFAEAGYPSAPDGCFSADYRSKLLNPAEAVLLTAVPAEPKAVHAKQASIPAANRASVLWFALESGHIDPLLRYSELATLGSDPCRKDKAI
jgi:hypothetical protein